MAAVTLFSDFGAQESKICHCFHFFSFYLPWSDGTRCHGLKFLECWILSFSLSFFTFIKRLSSSFLLSGLRVVLSAYVKCWYSTSNLDSSLWFIQPKFRMMYSAKKLNKQGDNIHPWCTPFPIWNQSIVPCPVLTVAFWSAYRFLRRQVRWSGIPTSWRIFHSLSWCAQSKALT